MTDPITNEQDPDNAPRWAIYRSHLGTYMRRWVVRTPFFTLRIHNILQSDEGRDLHDHPFDFVSVILRGGYLEHRPGCTCTEEGGIPKGPPCRWYYPGAVVCRKAEDTHRLDLLGASAWTFVVTGSYRRPWGFRLRDGSWQHHDAYHARYHR